tara:strand:- start:27256 stop:28398 length:1143 start_codon:yes stop_codon:yes gene_type:complete
MNNSYKSLFLLDPNAIHLNHGSFGACPKPIFDSLISWQKKLEFNPVKHLAFDMFEHLKESREYLSNYINCDKDDIVFFPNPSTALNAVIKSLDLKNGDEILTTNHEYGALDKTWNFICKKTGAKYIKQNISLPLKSKNDFINTFIKGINKNTKVIFISHITSPTGLIFPAEEICKVAKENNIFCIIDGAHVPGHINLDIKKLNPDIYTGACHKWMCAPKGTSFLYAKKEIQDYIDPLVISWGYDSEIPSHSKYLDYHQWQGTQDPSSYLTIPDVINFLNKNNWETISKECRKINIEAREMVNNSLNQEPISENNFIGQMSSIKIQCKDPVELQKIFYLNYKIIVPIVKWEDKMLLRFSIQAYNSMEDIEKLIFAIKKLKL